ncbi:arylsulfate sulfotransferase [Devosia geojensis]|uniref:Arylsulfate sulfotransferase n=1 Tax=Devosia geojensis TaxID=443610 RepID=A0A0F5FVZ4_9HYPH|nr:ribbon-helix-helix domain-containing protein [Devosia geojensis]KKB13036.1 arylsulfate sulfotransferase [Devosia geojensis]
MEKRSLSIAGHRTSLALEPEFWAGLEAMARSRELSLPQIIQKIDEERTTVSLSSAVRLAVLDWYRTQAGEIS